MFILEEHFKWHLQAFASELFILSVYIYIYIYIQWVRKVLGPPSIFHSLLYCSQWWTKYTDQVLE